MKITMKVVLVTGLVLASGCSHPPIQTAPWHKTVSGQISEINKNDYYFVVSSQDPANGITRIFQLKPDSLTRYQNAVGFRDVQIGDWVAVDFTQNTKGELMANHITLKKGKIEDQPEESENKKHSFLE